jgi:hypothetical protein
MGVLLIQKGNKMKLKDIVPYCLQSKKRHRRTFNFPYEKDPLEGKCYFP